jgi:hypothetical protein
MVSHTKRRTQIEGFKNKVLRRISGPKRGSGGRMKKTA